MLSSSRTFFRAAVSFAVVSLLVALILVAFQVTEFPVNSEAIAFDQGKCIESCDAQYSTCVRNNNNVPYCSTQHDRCRRACLAH